MTCPITSAASSVPALIPEKPQDLDIVEENARVIQIAKSVFNGIIPAKTQALIEEYLFVDLTRIYKEAGIVYDYLPKSLAPRRDKADLTPAKREKRVLFDYNDILSRMQREFAYAQAEMMQEPGKAFVYRNSDVVDSLATTLTEVRGYSIGACTCVGVKGRDVIFGTWNESFNEDRYTVEELYLKIGGKVYSMPFAAVFDGHSNSQAAQYASVHLKTVLLETLIQHNPYTLSHIGVWNALKIVCVNLKERWRSDQECIHTSGTTVLFFIELMGMVYVVNVGDSRGALNNKGIFLQLTDDADPAKPRFKKTIENRGGRVINGRTNGWLGTGRDMGDLQLGDSISARSKITMLPASFLNAGSDLVLVSDGVSNVSSTCQILKAAEDHPERSPDQLAKDYIFSSYGAHASDNLTAIVIRKREKDKKVQETMF